MDASLLTTGTAATAAMGAGLAWASGLRLYLAVFTAGVFSLLGWITLPSSLHVLQSPWVLGASGVMLCVEFLADKIPGLDSVWDAIHTFIRIPAGAILGAAALGEMSPAIVMAAGIVGGTIASGAHLTKAGSRAMINTSPEPVSNWAASFTEEAAVVGGLWTAFTHPAVFFVLLAIFFLFALWLLPKLWRGVKWLRSKLA